MGVPVALETLPFALVSLHAGVLLDRVRKLPIIIGSDLLRGAALLAIPAAAFTGYLSIHPIQMARVGSLVGAALATRIGLRATLLTVGVLAMALTAAAVLWSPVRRHRTLPAVAGD
jgi:hypothetical protein